MIRLENLSLGYGARTLLRDASLTLPAGTLTALVGRNGSGKSTLLRALAGLGTVEAGRVTIDGRDPHRTPAAELARRVAIVTTEKVRIPNLRCSDVVALGRAPYTNWLGRMQEEDRTVVEEALRLVGMESYADRTLERMSDGECQRVMIARALAQATPVILLDEPTSFLDLANRYEIGSLLRRLAREERKCILFSTHEIEIALTLCDRVALLDREELCCLPADEMAASGRIERLFGSAAEEYASLQSLLKRR